MVRRKAFTLVELMIALGIITLLAALLIPIVAAARRVAVRSRMKADVLAIGQGLEAYRLDHRDYPRLPDTKTWTDDADIDGSALLCWALIAPGPASQDGADGPGFRLRGIQGQTYGPYIDPSRFRISSSDDLTAEILDRNDRPIHYCPANTKADIYAPGGFIGNYGPYGGVYGPAVRPMYDHAYFEYCLSQQAMATMLGDTNANGQIDPGETPLYIGPYILWCAGPDGVFGPDPSDPMGQRSDDVTNFTP